MDKKYLIILLLAQITFSQAPNIEWQKYLGGSGVDYAYKIKQTNDGGYVVASSTTSNNLDVSGNHGGYDFWVVKLSSSGDIQWQKALGGTGDENVYSIQQTSDGGYIVVGDTNSNNGDVTGNHGGYDAWVVKLTSSGTIEWQKALGGSNSDQASSIQQTTDGGYIVGGYTSSFNGDVTGFHGLGDGWIVKLSNLGVIQWQKAVGGSDSDGIVYVQQTPDGGYVAFGDTSSNNGNVTGNHGSIDAWIVKLSSSGLLEWQKTYGGTTEEISKAIQQTSDGGYIFTCITWSNNGDVSGNHGEYDAWVVKVSDSGVIQWQKAFGGTNYDMPFDIQLSSDGGYVFVGWTNSNDGDVSGYHGALDAWIAKISAAGNLVWQKTIGGTNDDKVQSIQQTTDGGYAVAGITYSSNGDITANNGGGNAWVFKLASDSLETSDLAASNIKLYPNPASSFLVLQGSNAIIFDKITVTDLTGKTVLQQTQSTNQVNVESLAKGIYILQAFIGKEKFAGKFEKK